MKTDFEKEVITEEKLSRVAEMEAEIEITEDMNEAENKEDENLIYG